MADEAANTLREDGIVVFLDLPTRIAWHSGHR
jgi:hypothetical protein